VGGQLTGRACPWGDEKFKHQVVSGQANNILKDWDSDLYPRSRQQPSSYVTLLQRYQIEREETLKCCIYNHRGNLHPLAISL
jgi:hypothetical protein